MLKSFPLGGQNWNLMVGQGPKAGTYVIVLYYIKMQNDTGIKVYSRFCSLYSDYKNILIIRDPTYIKSILPTLILSLFSFKPRNTTHFFHPKQTCVKKAWSDFWKVFHLGLYIIQNIIEWHYWLASRYNACIICWCITGWMSFTAVLFILLNPYWGESSPVLRCVNNHLCSCG